MIDAAALHTELTTDPLGLGYARLLANRDTVELAALLNLRSGGGSALIVPASITKGAILLGIIPFLDQLSSGNEVSGAVFSTATVAKWMARFNAVRSGDDILALTPPLQAMFGQIVTDGLGTQAQLDGFLKRTGSRAEVLFGADAEVDPVMIYHACFNADGSAK